MKNIFASHCYRGALLAGALVPLLVAPAMAVDFTTADGKYTLSIAGNVNGDYVYTNCQSPGSAHAVAGGLACVGSPDGNGVSSVDNGLLPAAITFGITTTQDGFDIGAHFGFYPGIDTHTGGDPNNANAGGNYLTMGTQSVNVRGIGLLKSLADMNNIVVAEHNGTPILLRDVATVKEGHQPRLGKVGFNVRRPGQRGIVAHEADHGPVRHQAP